MEDGVKSCRHQYESYVSATADAREAAERDLDYAALNQWSDAERQVIEARNQACITFDYIGEQVDYFQGMERDNRTDPKALPRTAKHAEAADAATDALRYACDKADFTQTSSECFRDLLVPGTEAAIVEVEERKGDKFDIVVRHIPWDRFYYDPHSRRRDFADAKFMGIVVWLDLDEVKRLYPAARDVDGAFRSLDGAMEDAPIGWSDEKRKRLKVCQHYYLKGGVWYVRHFTGETSLLPEKKVGYVNEDGEPENPIVAQSAYIDRQNNRYGYVRRLIDPQDLINHARSKAHFLISSRQVLAEEGSVVDQQEAKRELNKPNGWVKLNPGALRDGTFQVGQTGDMHAGHMEMYREAVGKMNASGANAAMQGDAEGMSGRAIQRLQRGGSIQIGPIFDSHKNFRLRIYRQVFNRIRQFWDAPMWIRVTDDKDSLKWVGLNQPVTVGVELMEAAKAGNQEAAQRLQQAIAEKDPQLMQPIPGQMENNVAELDVDILLDETPDTLTSQEDTFKSLVELGKIYGPQEVPFKALVELSPMPHKKRVLDMLGGNEDPQAAMLAQMQQQLQQQAIEADLTEKRSKAALNIANAAKAEAQAQQIQVETAIVTELPDPAPTIIV